MPFQPPREEGTGSVPGYFIVLAAFSVLMFLLALAMGLLAFGVVRIGGNQTAESVDAGIEIPLEVSDFRVLHQQETDGHREMTVAMNVVNTGEDDLTGVSMLVQCTDGGNVSANKLLPPMAAGQSRRIELVLYGLGQPACSDPVIAFDR